MLLFICFHLEISGARFNANSYYVYEIDPGLRLTYRISISFRFYQPNGGLVFIPQNQNGSGNSLFVKLENSSLIAYARIGRETLELRYVCLLQLMWINTLINLLLNSINYMYVYSYFISSNKFIDIYSSRISHLIPRTPKQYNTSQWYVMSLSYSGTTLSLTVENDPTLRMHREVHTDCSW